MADKKKDDRLKELENLSPEERIERLKEIEEEDKKEIERAKDLIKDSEEEIELGEKIKHVEMPETKKVNVNELFKSEDSLEESVAKEKVEISEEEIRKQSEYVKKLPTQEIEQRAEYLQNRLQETGYITNEQRGEIVSMYQEISQREDGIKSGSYKSSSENIEEQLSVAKKILGDMYQR